KFAAELVETYALNPRRPPEGAQHLRAGDEALDGEALVLRRIGLRVEFRLLVQLIETLDEAVAVFEEGDDLCARVLDHARLRVDQGQQIIDDDVRLNELALEAPVESVVGR